MGVYVPLKERVASMTQDGLENTEIASKLGLSERAVRVHQAKTEGKLTAKELCLATEATYRQVNYWTVKGYLKPIDLGAVKGVGTQRKGSGSDVMFEPSVVPMVKMVMKMVAVGFEVEVAFDLAMTLRDSGALNHDGTGEAATAMIDLGVGLKLVCDVA